VLCLGALVAVLTGLGRLQVVGALLAALAFLMLASAAHRMKPVLATLVAITALALPLGALFISATGSGSFSRYETILESSPSAKCTDCKQEALGFIPHEIAVAPFGVGLGSVGAAGGFGGKNTELLEGHGVTSE